MRNSRGAGRKPGINSEQLAAAQSRHAQGESIARIAEDFGISRQALSQHLKKAATQTEFALDYLDHGTLISRIYADSEKEMLRLENYSRKLSEQPFGFTADPSWDDFGHWLEDLYLQSKRGSSTPSNPRLPMQPLPLCMECPKADFTLNDVMGALDADAESRQLKAPEGLPDSSELPRFEFHRRDLLLARTDTDGYQSKALSSDRLWFVKSQAIFHGIPMNDWAVEIIASRLCCQLNIPCVEQYPCDFVYEGRVYHGVCSRNFELDGYTFIAFERLLERMGHSSREEEFISLDAMEKLHWCARMLAAAGDLPVQDTTRYMLDLALIDCLVGNVDRHTRNFGLFYNNALCRYEIPLLFDNGMGLFEHDYYRDQNNSYEEAMRSVYVAPYGEDPFDMIRMLDEAFDLKSLYPALTTLNYGDLSHLTDFAAEYTERMRTLWLK